MPDPFTSLSIASSIFQIVSFSHEVYTFVKRIKEDVTVYVELREHTSHISDASRGLEEHIKGFSTNGLPNNHANLMDLAAKSLRTAEDIQNLINRVDNTRGGSLCHLLKSFWVQSKLDRLEKSMQSYRQDLRSHVLLHVW